MSNTFAHQCIKLAPLALIVIGLLSYNFMSAQWTGPTGAAPSNNVPMPLNVGTTSQTKDGVLTADSLYGTSGVVGNYRHLCFMGSLSLCV